MDPETFLDLANQVTKLKMYPYFDLAHSAVCLLAVREDLGAGKKNNRTAQLRRRTNLFQIRLLLINSLLNGDRQVQFVIVK